MRHRQILSDPADNTARYTLPAQATGRRQAIPAMKLIRTGAARRTVAALMIASHLLLYSGCATLAHRSSVSGERVRHTSNCEGGGDVCPWLLGDAGLLLLGIVPGVIAFIVDFGTGAWQHQGETEVRTASDEVASVHLLFDAGERESSTGAVASAANPAAVGGR